MSVNEAALIEIVGVNGELWTVSGPGMGEQGVILADDLEALFDEAPWTAIWRQGATQEGATLEGVSPEPIDLVLSFETFSSDSGMPWDEVEARFFQSFDTIKEATIRITDNGEARTLRVVKMTNAKMKSKKDPRLIGKATIILTLRAGWPYWEGDTYTSTFAPSGVDGVWEGEVIVSNPTDAPIYLEWSISAPGVWHIPDHDFENPESPPHQISLPPLTVGQFLTIDTYPREETYILADGTNFAGRMGGVDFLHPIPPRTPETRLPIRVSGHTAGAFAQARMVRHWKRPTGKVYL